MRAIHGAKGVAEAQGIRRGDRLIFEGYDTKNYAIDPLVYFILSLVPRLL